MKRRKTCLVGACHSMHFLLLENTITKKNNTSVDTNRPEMYSVEFVCVYHCGRQNTTHTKTRTEAETTPEPRHKFMSAQPLTGVYMFFSSWLGHHPALITSFFGKSLFLGKVESVHAEKILNSTTRYK